MLRGAMVKRQFPLFSKIIESSFVDNYDNIMKNLHTSRIEDDNIADTSVQYDRSILTMRRQKKI